MSETKIFAMPDSGNGGGGSNGILAMLPALMQQRGLDPNILALANGRNGGNGGWGDGLFAILLLFILMGRGGLWGNQGGGGFMGNGQGGVVPMLNNDANTAVIMQAVQRNGFDIASLATALNTSSDAVLAAINSLSGQFCNLGNQMGQNTNQIVTAVMQGNNSIISQLCSCCCDIKQLIAQFGADNRLAMCQQTNALTGSINNVAISQERGFSSLNYALADQGCQSRQNADANTRAILAKLDAMEDSRKDREIATLTAQLTAANSRAERQTELAPIYKQLADISCKQPQTVNIPYIPAMSNLVPVSYSQPVSFGVAPYANGCGC